MIKTTHVSFYDKKIRYSNNLRNVDDAFFLFTYFVETNCTDIHQMNERDLYIVLFWDQPNNLSFDSPRPSHAYMRQ